MAISLIIWMFYFILFLKTYLWHSKDGTSFQFLLSYSVLSYFWKRYFWYLKDGAESQYLLYNSYYFLFFIFRILFAVYFIDGADFNIFKLSLSFSHFLFFYFFLNVIIGAVQDQLNIFSLFSFRGNNYLNLI